MARCVPFRSLAWADAASCATKMGVTCPVASDPAYRGRGAGGKLVPGDLFVKTQRSALQLERKDPPPAASVPSATQMETNLAFVQRVPFPVIKLIPHAKPFPIPFLSGSVWELDCIAILQQLARAHAGPEPPHGRETQPTGCLRVGSSRWMRCCCNGGRHACEKNA
jgi:hypothetical protein